MGWSGGDGWRPRRRVAAGLEDPPRPPGDRGGGRAAPPAGQLAQELRAQPQNILHYLNISPVMVNDKLSGYRLNAGKKPALFRQAGLKENDRALALNGLDLRDKEQSRQALAQLSEVA